MYELVLTKIEADCKKPLLDLSQDEIINYFNRLREDGLSFESVRHNFYILNAYYNWVSDTMGIDNRLDEIKGKISELFC